MSVLDGPRREYRPILLDGRPQWCEPDGDMLVLPDGRRIPERDAVHLSPCEPSKILCVHLDFRSRAVEFGRSLEGEPPTYFQKPVSALNAHRGALVLPADCHWLDYEGEIAAVVGRAMRNVSPADVWDHLAGFASANEVGAHDFRDTDAGLMLRVKGMDGFCPIGPGIVRGSDVRESTLRTFLNREVVQEGPIAEMVWRIDYLLADLSRHITLLPGDVVLTGTPWHSRPMAPGDVVEVEIDGLGRLVNTVVVGPQGCFVLSTASNEFKKLHELGATWPEAVADQRKNFCIKDLRWPAAIEDDREQICRGPVPPPIMRPDTSRPAASGSGR